ncbi:hypothetical protein B0J12DRAFT_268597 [Macrophomina phaseolina]|uniref:Inner centromere protein ARK-binding domain-containing protein n=1 Tax=Macrophomina phaseolina TaxID=35725 RepID=A0ABQ8FY65_9PEZI|nr:hypothetical protein B0J12DRAFT_268597 [Macrophomina phaseolina]
MTAPRSKVAVGSAPWILSERQQAAQFVEQEVDEFSYSVRNEMEWLNEHMAEIFTRPELNVADAFKTPGKLRGKTPRTARKRNPLETRAPLTDIFAPNPANAPSPTRENSFYKQIEQIQIAEDPEDAEMPPPPQPAQDPHHITDAIPPGDSGYHGMTDDEMEVDEDGSVARFSPHKQSPVKSVHSSPSKPQETPAMSASASFVSAKEDMENQTPSQIDISGDDDVEENGGDDEETAHENEMDLASTQRDESPVQQEHDQPKSPQYSVGDHTASVRHSGMNIVQDQQEEQEQVEEDGARTPSEGSSPAKPLLRKSSLTFSSLPAREPLAGKRSMGNRASRTSHVDQYKARSSHFGRYTGGKSLGGSQAVQLTQDEDKDMADRESEDEKEELHTKTSTQRLHERINMLAKHQESRASKSISESDSQEPNYPQLPSQNDGAMTAPETSTKAVKAPSPVPNIEGEEDEEEDDDDDWIAPVTKKPPPPALTRPALRKSSSADVMEKINGKSSIGGLDADLANLPASEKKSPVRARLGHVKAVSVPNFGTPAKTAAKEAESSHKKALSNSDPDLLQDLDSNTPVGSPSRGDDGPLSASKTKFFSVLKSAKSIFASSAGVSAQAKLEALSPSSARIRNKAPAMEEVSSPSRPTLSSIFDKPVNPASPPKRPATAIGTPMRTTRASLERERKEKELEAQKEQEEALEKEREEEEASAAAEKAKQGSKSVKENASARLGAVSRADTVSSRDDDYTSADDAPKPASTKLGRGPPKMREPKSRLLKPTGSKEALNKPRQIRVGLGSQRTHPTNADLSKSLHGTLPPSAKTSGDSANSSFTKSTGPAGAPVAKPTSLALAAKNKEREEREAQRKAEKKRAIEQQRAEKAAKAEEERRRADEERRAEAQRKAAEQQRAQEAKRAASRQALAAEAKKQEQLRAKAASKQTNDLAQALSKEKAATIHGHPRGDLGGARPISRVNTVLNIPPVNPAKPPKRFHAEEEEPASRPQAPRNGPAFQQLNAKRRKTLSDDEEEEPADNRRSMMAPPIRQSNVRKLYPERERLLSVIDKAKEPNKFTHGYKPAPSGSSHAPSMFKQTVKAQHQMQHSKLGGHPNDMATISKAKIPFANTPGPSSSAAAGPSNTFKTPSRTTTVPLASPHFPTPELPEIATDSEDEESDSEANNFQAPSWVNSPALRELLTQQQLVDPLEVFGPIPPLQMEEIFKNKDRHKRFRERTSSAHWTADRLTEEERKKDREGRERLMRDGGWTYGNTNS